MRLVPVGQHAMPPDAARYAAHITPHRNALKAHSKFTQCSLKVHSKLTEITKPRSKPPPQQAQTATTTATMTLAELEPRCQPPLQQHTSHPGVAVMKSGMLLPSTGAARGNIATNTPGAENDAPPLLRFACLRAGVRVVTRCVI
jgi:hypothetical protein